MNMIVRKIEGDFSTAKIDWIPNDPELAQFWNAVSLGLPLLEGYMIRAVSQAKRELPESRAFKYQQRSNSEPVRRPSQMSVNSGFIWGAY
ncbi:MULTISPECIES: metal-dependent hydrolase [Zhongshania]|jgi:predicted metal-dependent hydrolase|uniref:Putative metal-dependent hydrolase n=1 Tax=Zhongshania antarctica TaxID=641702 RepID=A0A840R9N9_9GAMM|nr:MULTISPECIES: metal-dependent hydrolase [Zhongshania]MBB5189072.1 putative metal-dependent hydrolase [Zhongshania antarctica]